MHHFLPEGVVGVALVGVVEDEFAVIGEHEGLPDGFVLVLWEGDPASGHRGDKFPGVARRSWLLTNCSEVEAKRRLTLCQ